MRQLLAAGVIALLLMGGCQSQETRRSIVIGEGTDFGVLLPVAETSALDGEINSQLYRALNSARWGDGAIEYVVDDLSLAESWSYGPDSTTLTYLLRSDAVWSDGHPIDAQDVVFTFRLVRKPEIASPYIDVWDQLDSLVAVDSRRVTFFFKRRYPGMLFDTGIGIIPAHVFEGFTDDNATLTGHATLVRPDTNLVVSGAYRVAEWIRGDRLVLQANPRSFGAAPATETVIFRVLPEETTRLVELENGELDVMGPLPMGKARELEAAPQFRIEAIRDRFFDYIAWNESGFGPFRDPETRKALSLAIDRGAILAGLGITDFARPAAGPYPPIFRQLNDPGLTADPYLPDSARAILAGKGWKDSDADGVVDRGNLPFRFTLLTQAENQRRTSAAEIIQAQLAGVGIDMQIRLVEFNSLLGLVLEQRDFQAVLLGWQVALEPDYVVGFFWPADHPFNVTGYASAQLDNLIPLALAAATAEDAADHWRAAARVIATDRPYAFLWFYDDPIVVNERVKNTRIDTYGIYQNLYQWRLED